MNRDRTSEDGAAAVLVAVLALMLLGLVGLTVDLGNAWARGRAVQSQVDLSAMSAGHLLPMQNGVPGRDAASVADEVAQWMGENDVTGQGAPAITGAQLRDGTVGNGEVTFFASQAHATAGTPACVNVCPVMSVLAPKATVGFGFAAAMPGIGDSVGVQRTAVVAVESELPPMQDMLPFWLPSGCGFGPVEADTTQGGNSSQTSESEPSAPAEPVASAVVTLPTGDHELTGSTVAVPAGLTQELSGFRVTGISNPYNNVSLRAIRPDGMSYIDFSAQRDNQGQLSSFTIGPADVTGTPGSWRLYALAAKNNGDTEYSANHLVLTVTGVAPAPTEPPAPSGSPTPSPSSVLAGCVGQDRGNFGQLSSPRADESNDQKAFPRNVATGLDHRLLPYSFPVGAEVTKDCGSGSSLLPGAQNDTTGGTAGNGANCIRGDTGNDGPKTYDGLVGGVDELNGRLDAANGTTVCTGRTNQSFDNQSLNDDTLACFLRNGATLAQIASESGVTSEMLDPAIVDSPRFVYLPVVYAEDRAQKSFQPIKTFVPGFITHETQTSGPSTSDVNGLDIKGNSVSALHVFTFNRAALPPQENSDSTDYDPAVGGSLVRLVG